MNLGIKIVDLFTAVLNSDCKEALLGGLLRSPNVSDLGN